MRAHVVTMEAVFPAPSGHLDHGEGPPPLEDTAPSPRFPPPSQPQPQARVAAGETEAPSAEPPPAPLPASFTGALLAPAESFSLSREAARFATGLGLAALYGVALGARHGGAAIFRHAAGVPAAIAAVSCVGVPALYIGLALFDVPIEPTKVASSAARSAAATGLVLAGLAPAAALFVVSSDLPRAAAIAGMIGLAIAGLIGLKGLLRELHGALSEARAATRATAELALVGFAIFAIALSMRIWWSLLPVLGGAS